MTDWARQLHSCLDGSMQELNEIWDSIGISGESRTSRCGIVLMHTKNLLDEMVGEEKALRDNLMSNIKKFKVDVAQICIELGIQKYELPEGMTILRAEKELKQKLDNLNKEKEDRMTKLKSLVELDDELSGTLATTPYHISHYLVPTLKQLDDFQTHIQELQQEKDKRFEKLVKLQRRIEELLDKLELSPNTSFERNVVCEFDLISLNEDNLIGAENYKNELEMLFNENMNHADSLMKNIRSLWKKLNIPEEECQHFEKSNCGFCRRIIISLEAELRRCEDLKIQNIRQFVEATREELRHFWNICFVPAEARNKFQAFNDDVMTEELLEKHESEVAKMKLFYEENKQMLELISKRENLWSELLELERKACDPNRYINRGGNLLAEEKQRKTLENKLPKVEKDVKKSIEDWEKESGKEFRIGGIRYEEHIQRQWDNHVAEKENEKLLRQQQKAKQMEEEIKYGSKPSMSGTKRFAAVTPSKTPNKSRKVETPTSSRIGSALKSKRNILSPAPNYMRLTNQGRTPQSNTLDLRSIGSSTIERASSCQTLNSNRSTRPPVSSQSTVVGGSMVGINVISTTVVAPRDGGDVSSASLCPVGQYEEFANGLNKVSRNNSRSTLLPKPGPSCL